MDNKSSEMLKILLKKIRYGIHNDEWEKLFNGPYLFPCEEPSFLNNLKGEDDVIDVNDYFIFHDKNFLRKHSKFKSIIDNETLNPSKEYRLLKYFVKTKNFDQLNIIFDYAESDANHKQNIVLIGNKGSGKTAVQNCWIYENNSNLEQRNILWFRCDGHRLYEQWLGYLNCQIPRKIIEQDHTKLVSIEEYLDIQILYVFSKYCLNEKRPFFIGIFDKIKNQEILFDFPISRKNIDTTEKKTVFSYVNSLRILIDKEEYGKQQTFSYAFDVVMKNSSISAQRDKRRWIKCSIALQEFFKKEGLYILKIIDGMDNIHINDEVSKPYYDKMLDFGFNFIKHRPNDNCIHLMAIRERTYLDMVERYPLLQQSKGRYNNVLRLDAKLASFDEILLKRYDYAIKENFFSSGDLYDNIAKEVMKLSEGKNVNAMYHGNIRVFLYNRMSLISAVLYRLKQLEYEGIKSHISSIVKLLENRNRFLNGRLFLSTRAHFEKINNEVGLCSMNIFYFNVDSHPCYGFADWKGLCKTRILQVLTKYSSVDSKKIEEFVSESFGYDNQFVKQSINDLRAFGMIDSCGNNSYKIVYGISEKGKYEFNNIFSDIDTLYYYGLDSFLPEKLITRGFILAHSNKFGSHRTNYPTASAHTAISFIIFLILKNKQESMSYSKIRDNLFIKHSLILEDSDLKLPFRIRTIIKRIATMFSNESDIEYKKLSSFLNSRYFISL